MRRKRGSRKDRLRLASAALEQASASFPSEVLQELIATIVKLCTSKTIRRCTICTEVVEEIVHVSARLLSGGNGGCFLDEGILLRLAMVDDIVQSAIRDSSRHKSAGWFRSFKHDDAAVRKTKEQLRQANSSVSGTATSCSSPLSETSEDLAATPLPSSPPQWTKYAQIACQGVATVVQDIPMVGPLSAIPKVVGASVKAFATRYENAAARDELRDRVLKIEALGDFPYLQEPIHNLEQVSQRMDSRRPLKRLIHATSEEALLHTADKKINRGLVMQNLVQILRTEQRLQNTMKTQTLILLTGIFFSTHNDDWIVLGVSCGVNHPLMY